MEDYYKILGITEEEKALHGDEFKKIVKSKYSKLAAKWHPDHWQQSTKEEQETAANNFQKVREAYETLEDEKKRQEYDTPSASFGDMFGGFNPFFHPFGNGFNGFKMQRAENLDVKTVITLTFDEAYNGCKKDIKVKYSKPCSHCNGTGSEDGKEEKCPYCNGTGTKVNHSRRGNVEFTNLSPCPHCNGTGKLIKNPCHVCHGTGKEYEYKTVSVDLPSGILSGQTIIFGGKGNIGSDGNVGDLLVAVQVTEDDYFKFSSSNNLNIVHEEEIPFNEAILGCEREIRLPNGKKEKLILPPCTSPYYAKRYSHMGMPDLEMGRDRGDYIIVIKYILPEKLTDKQKEMLKNFND